jgi:hypothetical protein
MKNQKNLLNGSLPRLALQTSVLLFAVACGSKNSKKNQSQSPDVSGSTNNGELSTSTSPIQETNTLPKTVVPPAPITKTNTEEEIKKEKQELEQIKKLETLEFGKLELSDKRFVDVQILGETRNKENTALFEIPTLRKSSSGTNLLRSADPISFRLPIKVGESANKELKITYGLSLDTPFQGAECLFGSLGYKGPVPSNDQSILKNFFNLQLQNPVPSSFSFGKTLVEFSAGYHDCGVSSQGKIKGTFYTFGTYNGSNEGVTQQAPFEVELIAETLFDDIGVDVLNNSQGNFSSVKFKNISSHELLPIEVDALVQCDGDNSSNFERIYMPRYFYGYAPNNIARYQIPSFGVGEVKEFTLKDIKASIVSFQLLKNCASRKAVIKGFEMRETNGWAPFPIYSKPAPSNTKFEF